MPKGWPPKECQSLNDKYMACFKKLSWSWTDDSEEREACDETFERLQSCVKEAMIRSRRKEEVDDGNHGNRTAT